jgi:hypothetical protein
VRLKPAKHPRAIDSTALMALHLARLPELLKGLTIRGILQEYLQSSEPVRPHQVLIDAIIRSLLRGEDPRVLLDTRERRPGLKSDLARECAAASEVARLTHELPGHDRVEAIHQVALVYHVSVRTVERWCNAHDDRSVDVSRYIADLKAAGLLK